MSFLAKLNSTTLFLRELVTTPKEVGAVLPSSRGLARAMARWIPREPDAYALELGPGTGVVTHAMLEQGLPPERLIAVEQSPKMADLLRTRFPGTHIITGDAFKVDELIRTQTPFAGKIGAVISSLPLLNFEPREAESLGRKILDLLPMGGKYVQFSYNLAKKPKAGTNFHFVTSTVVWLNVPPARVSVFQK